MRSGACAAFSFSVRLIIFLTLRENLGSECNLFATPWLAVDVTSPPMADYSAPFKTRVKQYFVIYSRNPPECTCCIRPNNWWLGKWSEYVPSPTSYLLSTLAHTSFPKSLSCHYNKQYGKRLYVNKQTWVGLFLLPPFTYFGPSLRITTQHTSDNIFAAALHSCIANTPSCHPQWATKVVKTLEGTRKPQDRDRRHLLVHGRLRVQYRQPQVRLISLL